MWSEFSRRNANFVRNYIVYHYYRSKGWVPQIGLKYGTDLGNVTGATNFDDMPFASELVGLIFPPDS